MGRWRLLVAWMLVAACAACRADNGVEAGVIRIGMANALSGPAAGLGWQLRAGAHAYLDKINAAGGVHGRRITLVSMDDGYDPQQTVAATRTLLDVQKVFALFGYVGTPTSTAAVPLAAQRGVPYLFPFTGAEFLRHPVQPVVFNLRASYYDEAEALVAQATAGRADARIAVFLQDDEFGEAGKAGVLRALQKRNLKLAQEVRFQRNTIDVGAGLDKLLRQPPDTVIFIGTYRPLAILLRRARSAGLKSRFMAVSFTGTSELIKHAGVDGEGVILSQVMPSPADATDPLVRQYQADVVPAARNYGSLEGYADAMLLVEALRRCGSEPTRAQLLKALEQLKMTLGENPVAFSAQEHQGWNRVYLTQVHDGAAAPLRPR